MKLTAIKENHLYRKAYQGGRRAAAANLCVYILRDKKSNVLKKAHPEKKLINRVGIAASKKIGGAVERNRAKRVIRAIETNHVFRGIPFGFHFIRFWQTILPVKAFDFIFGKVFGIYHAMDDFKGRK